MSIELEPSELSFQRPFTREVTQTLHIRNSNYDPVAFKVKTTAPKQYCVRPNSGRIESGKEVEVQVLLQAMKNDPPTDFKCRDKFLVQSVPITADREAVNVQEIWSLVEKNEKSAIQEKKIRVVYLSGDNQINSIESANVSFPETSPPPYGSPLPQGDTTVSTPIPIADFLSQPTHISSGDGASTFSATANEDTELNAAKATISKLEAELKEQALRLRKAAAVASDSKERIASGNMGITTHPPEGIPVQICAGLCLVAFFIAWFFF
ncbi:PapD-like protein [Geopyxis carbonaria]|nr:PapD-like protein [Geopyxis carbonaria]